jgi:hypothetical protein
MATRSISPWLCGAAAFSCAAAFTLTAHAEEPARIMLASAAAESLTSYAAILTLFTGLLVAVAGIQIAFLRQADETAKASAKTAREAAELARQSLIAGQRAWIRIDEIAGRGLFTVEGDSACAAFSFKISNVGAAPATRIALHVRLAAAKDAAAALALRQAMCDEIRRAPLSDGFALFPGESYPGGAGHPGWTQAVSIGRTEIETCRAASPDAEGAPLFLIGCVDYTFPADEGAHRQTAFLLELRRHNGVPFDPDETPFPMSQVALMEEPAGAGRLAD